MWSWLSSHLWAVGGEGEIGIESLIAGHGLGKEINLFYSSKERISHLLPPWPLYSLIMTKAIFSLLPEEPEPSLKDEQSRTRQGEKSDGGRGPLMSLHKQERPPHFLFSRCLALKSSWPKCYYTHTPSFFPTAE